MVILRFLLKLVSMLHSELSANSLAAGLALGMALGLMPLLSLQAVVALAVILFLKVNLTAAMVAFFFWKGVSLGLAPVLDPAGTALLSAEGLQGFWTFATNAPGLSLCSLGNSVALAGTLAAHVLVIPAFFLTRFLILRYRTNVKAWMARSRLLTFLKGHKMYALYRRALSPLF